MKKGLRRILRIGGLVVGVFVLLVAAAVLLLLFDKPLVKNLSQSYLTKKTGMPVHIGSLDYRLFPLYVVASSLKISYKAPVYTVDVLVNRLEARGELGKLLKGSKPAFETVDLDGVEVRYDQSKILETPIDFVTIIPLTGDVLGYAQRTTFSNGRLVFILPGQDFRLENFGLALSRTTVSNTFDLLLDGQRLAAALTAPKAAFESRLHIDGTLTLARTAGVNLHLGLGAPRFTAAGVSESFDSIAFETEGTWGIPENKISISRLALTVPGLIAAAGSGVADFTNGMSFNGRIQARVESLEAVATRAARYLPAAVRDWHIQGRVVMEGTYDRAPHSQGKADSLEASIALDGLRLDSRRADFPLSIGLSGNLKVAGLPANPRVTADLRASAGKISFGKLSIRGSAAHLEVQATRDSAVVSGLESSLIGLTATFPDGKKLAFDEVKVNGTARLDIKRKSLVLSSLETRLPGLPAFLLTAQANLTPRGKIQARLETKGQKIPALRALAAPFLPAALAGWDFDGSLDVALEARNTAARKSTWDLSGTFGLSQARFNDPSFTFAGEGLEPLVKISGTYDLSRGNVAFDGSLEISQGESLWKDLYIAWTNNPLRAEFRGAYNPETAGLDPITLRLEFPTLGEVRAAGSIRLGAPPSFDLKTDARLKLEPIYSLYAQAGASAKSRLHLSGDLSAALQVRKDKDALSVEGLLIAGDAAFESSATGSSLKGIQAEVPVRFLNPGPGSSAGSDISPAEGRLRIQEIKTPLVSFGPLALILHSLPNAYRIDPFSLGLFGSRLEFAAVSLAVDPRTGTFRGRTSLRLADLDLSRLPIASPQVPLTGKVRAEFSEIDISPGRITSLGQGEVDIFGGRVVIRNIAVTNPFLASRAISCDLDLLDLDLKKMTDIVPFGEVTGILRGEVKDLILSYGQPERFSLKIESVKKKGVSQTFSLKAIDNLTVISSGEQASMGSNQFWMRFIRSFHYEKLGIVSTLKNDIFTLNGTIKENGIEYLVKKPTFFGINVINRMPDKKISFKEMVNRLSRVGQSDKPKVTS